MISLETAKKLKKAGLKWEPETCDTYYWPRKFNNPVVIMHDGFELLKKEQTTKGITWAPRLSQLLAEIEKRGYTLHLLHQHWGEKDKVGYRECLLYKDGKPQFERDDIFNSSQTWEGAAAQALLWILGREGACNAVHV